MKTRYKYIHMVLVKWEGKTQIWNIINNTHGSILGGIAWYPPWRQYCFYSAPDIVYNAGCLADIQDFIKQLMDARKEK